MLDERRHYGAAGAAPAHLRHSRHSAYPPSARLTVAADEADRHKLIAVEHSNREGIFRLVSRELLERLMRTEDCPAQLPRALYRDRPEIES